MFSSILVFCLLIGSTFAATELQKMQSLLNVDLYTKISIEKMSGLYPNGFLAFMETDQYKALRTLEPIIGAAVYYLSNFQQFPHSANAVYNNWTIATHNVIDELMNHINWEDRNPKDNLLAPNSVIGKLSELMENVNNDPNILIEHKGTNLSIYNRLKEIIQQRSVQQATWFQRQCEAAAQPPQ